MINLASNRYRGHSDGRLQSPVSRSRSGKIIVLFALMLPMLMAFVGLVLDGSNLLGKARDTQHAADAAATAAAIDKLNDASDAEAAETARKYVQEYNGLNGAGVTVNIPPSQGAYAGNANYVEVIVTREIPTYIMQAVSGGSSRTVRATAVAGFEPATVGVAVMALDANPAQIAVPAVENVLWALGAQTAGLEKSGGGELRINGAVLVNTRWGDVNENGTPAGDGAGPPYGIVATYSLGHARLFAQNFRVTGGVDDTSHYPHIVGGQPSPLRANRRPTLDPLRNLPVATTSADSVNVSSVMNGGVTISKDPVDDPPSTLNPGVYDWIDVEDGKVTFNPGVYIVRGVNPATNIALKIESGQVTAEGVMFYVTDSSGYDPSAGDPDSSDGEGEPPAASSSTLTPSVVIRVRSSSSYSPLNDVGSPFDGMIVFQRRRDRRPVIISRWSAFGSASFAGTVYAKWAQIIFAARGTYDAKFVGGSLRFINFSECTIAPSELLPPAQDVFLVE